MASLIGVFLPGRVTNQSRSGLCGIDYITTASCSEPSTAGESLTKRERRKPLLLFNVRYIMVGITGKLELFLSSKSSFGKLLRSVGTSDPISVGLRDPEIIQASLYGTEGATKRSQIPCYKWWIPCYSKIIPCSVSS